MHERGLLRLRLLIKDLPRNIYHELYRNIKSQGAEVVQFTSKNLNSIDE